MSSRKPLSDNKKRKMRSATRLYALQALFQMEQSKQSVDVVRSEFLSYRFGAEYEGERLEKGDVHLFTHIINEAVNQDVEASGTKAMELNDVIVLPHTWVGLDDGSNPLNECLQLIRLRVVRNT
mgnify:CR=1 FL=1